MAYPQLASNDSTTFAAPVGLFAGSMEVTTNRAQVGTNINLAQYTVVALVNDLLVAWNPAGSDGSQNIVGILATDGDTRSSGGVPGRWAPYYTGGDFNHAALVWPASIDTLAERRAAFAGLKTINISTIL